MKSLSIGTEVCGIMLLDLIQFIGLFSFFQTVWGLNHVDEVFVRIGVIYKKTSKKKQIYAKNFRCTFIQVSANDPKGKEWTKVDGTMSQIR